MGRVIYISSTGVYGQTDGTWVDESTECRPTRAGGQACLAAEQLLLQSAWAARTLILRLAGIYGPQRLPRLRQLQSGESLDTAPLGLLNLIHVDDAAQVVRQVADQALSLPPRVPGCGWSSGPAWDVLHGSGPTVGDSRGELRHVSE